MRDARGRYLVGHDDTRHVFTREECRRGFWNALQSIVERYPDATYKNGDHICINFLRRGGRRNGNPR